MSVYRLGATTVHHADDHTLTVFDGGGEVRGDHAPQPGQDETAAQYGLSVEAMSRALDLAHSILSAALGLPASPTLSAMPGGKHWSHWWREEQAVLALQGCAAVTGVDPEQIAARLSKRET
ncbi:hypothetical protein [Paracoccus chinensis]|uniref:Uncharacterized protein n=1 Tax=Paracoccus chinensis TaxID=525640 RepID=A0A1G9IZA2_9RHOB|nr:hypothetical protein [Paracoccus chinensis]SDL30598.1 hypothetical protein SAMN04487971_108195 [Paracoccus chinensis]